MRKKRYISADFEIISMEANRVIVTSNDWGANSDKVEFGGGTSDFDAPARYYGLDDNRYRQDYRNRM